MMKRQRDSQTVRADRGILSHHAVLADRRYHADRPNPEDLKDQEDPETGEKTLVSLLSEGI